MSFTWKNGREMATANINGKNCSYYYNTDGIRTRKIAGTETTDYFVDDSGRIIGQESSTGRKILFMYDGSGAVVGMRYKSNASAQYVDYYYVKNAQGDITGIVDKDGVLKYTYEYDSWGKLLNIKTSTGAVLNPAVINYATQNPFRYRGYYYDNETGFYYLNSRYYDPTVKRFINADSSSLIGSTPSSLSDNNLYNYCDNNPIIRYDDGGKFWETVFDIFSLATSVIDVINNPDDPMAWVGLVGDALDLIPFVTGVGETVRIVNTTKKVVNKADDMVKPLHRPYIRKSVREAVEKAAPKLADGTFLDINTGKPIVGKYDLGHVKGHEFWREKKKATKQGMNQKQFNNYMNNPRFYQIESPSSNRSHKYEKKVTFLEKRFNRLK